METPKNTVGTQVTGTQRDNLPDRDDTAVTEATQPAREAVRPSEVEHPHAQSADHLRAAAPAHHGGGEHETSAAPPRGAARKG